MILVQHLANLNVRRIDILKVINITNARKDLYNLIQKVNENSEPVLITGKECNTVLISEGDWNSICETMRLKSIPGMEESLLKGKESSLSDCITEEKNRRNSRSSMGQKGLICYERIF